MIELTAYEDEEWKEMKLNEINGLFRMKHENIISLYEVCKGSEKKKYKEDFYLIFELCEGGELISRLNE